MPLSNSESRSHSVLETSLTELAFTFFFILAIFASWKISDAAQELTKQEIISEELTGKVDELTDSLNEASKFAALGDDFDPAELFVELRRGKDAIIDLEKAKEKEKILEDKINEFSSLIGEREDINLDDIISEMAEIKEIKEILANDESSSSESILEQVKQLRDNANDVAGQNINLRNKLEALGNGLDHPPCWANPVTGKIEYIFDVVINETSLDVYKGWPESRNEQAISNPNIIKSIGNYISKGLLWKATSNLFEESKIKECRHFVRVYDDSESKSSFKYYLLGIENHFYKFLSNSKYER